MLSRFARALWIEITWTPVNGSFLNVEVRESLVDWNIQTAGVHFNIKHVEVRESLVDWNMGALEGDSIPDSRGSREPCGLKYSCEVLYLPQYKSRFARALWIEITLTGIGWTKNAVEVRESLVDWNRIIESKSLNTTVEVRESLVDWNSRMLCVKCYISRRGSREPCGLKLNFPLPYC